MKRTDRIGVVTGRSAPKLTEDGQAIVDEFRERGFEAEPVVWSDAAIEWSGFDVLLVRSCWNYYQQPDAFREWIDTVAEQVTVVLNDPDILRWNVHKSYLRELATAGVPVAPTALVERGSTRSLETILDQQGWHEAVVKPAIGTSSAGVWRVSRPVSADANRRFDRDRADTDLLVQQFLPEIETGELSVVFLAGEYSHASRTVPATGEFRAHHSYGGTSSAVTPSDSLLAQANDVLETTRDRLGVDPAEVPYARVDGVERDSTFVVLELELIEPYLGLSAVDGGIERFVDAVERATREIHV